MSEGGIEKWKNELALSISKSQASEEKRLNTWKLNAEKKNEVWKGFIDN